MRPLSRSIRRRTSVGSFQTRDISRALSPLRRTSDRVQRRSRKTRRVSSESSSYSQSRFVKSTTKVPWCSWCCCWSRLVVSVASSFCDEIGFQKSLETTNARARTMIKEEEKTKEQQKHQLKRLGVETNLNPTSWHGAFSCSLCARKRLPACEFSQAQVKKKRANENASLVCLRCSEREEEERIQTTMMAGLKMNEEKGVALHECSKCKELKPETAFARSQLRNKGPGKQKCSKSRRRRTRLQIRRERT